MPSQFPLMLEAQSGRVRCLFLYLPEEWINHYLSNTRYLKWKGSRCCTLSKTASASVLWGHESWDSVGSNMQLLNILIQLLCTCKVTVDRQCLLSQRRPVYLAFNAHSPVPIRVHKVRFQKSKGDTVPRPIFSLCRGEAVSVWTETWEPSSGNILAFLLSACIPVSLFSSGTVMLVA